MSKKLFFLIGLLTGALLLELFYRPLKARLQAAEAVVAERDRFNERARKSREAHYNSLSTEEKIRYSMAMATWRDDDEEEE